jgi:hypothetical protein
MLLQLIFAFAMQGNSVRPESASEIASPIQLSVAWDRNDGRNYRERDFWNSGVRASEFQKPPTPHRPSLR